MRLSRLYTSLALLGLWLWPAPAFARAAPDLKLHETDFQRLIISPQPNPHEKIQCPECHLGPVSGSPKPMEIGEYLKDDYPDELCLRCHKKDLGHLHPSDIDPATGRLKTTVPKILPVRFMSVGRVKITCMTCHSVHYPHTGFNLLRGFAIDPRVQVSTYRTRLDFCRSCHGKELSSLSPHLPHGAGGVGCALCHPSKEPGTSPGLRSDINTLCSYCHPTTYEPHYLHYNPFPDMTPEQIASTGLPLREGTFTCLTCHVSHRASLTPRYLRMEYIAVARVSQRINPHQEALCYSCHAEIPQPAAGGGPPATSSESAISDTCTRCHQSGKITGMDHPLRRLPDHFRKPNDLPLTVDGRVACTTCHLARHGPANPDSTYLRVPIYASIKELCLRCHVPDPSRNPHREFQKNSGCDICHGEGDVYEYNDLTVGDLLADPIFLCLRCHDEPDHPGGRHHTLRLGKYDYVSVNTREMPLDSFKRITCYTCHEIHQYSNAPNFLRFSSTYMDFQFCRNCHPY